MPNTPAEARLAIVNRISLLLTELAGEEPGANDEVRDHFGQIAELIVEDLGIEVAYVEGEKVGVTITPIDGWF